MIHIALTEGGTSGSGLVSDEELCRGPRRPWFGPYRPLLHRLAQPIIDILRVEAAGGVALVAAAVVALVWANSPWQDAYEEFWSTEVALEVGGFMLREDLRHWVNDGLMVLFFFVVGLEIKTELVAGELADATTSPVALGVAAGLLLGKPAGILGASWLATRLGGASLPSGVGWRHMAGAGVVAGIGFTMSLFIAGLAFSEGSDAFQQAKLGIFSASLVAAAVGSLVLLRRGRRA
jgi:NhaA family Na+:H+ antiporter